MAANPAFTAKFDKDPGQAKVGDTVTVTLGIENNPGVLIMGGILEYDESVLELKDGDIKNGDIFSTFLHGNPGDGMKLNWLGNIMAGDTSANGTIATVTFTVVGKDPDGSTEVKFLFDEENGAFNFNEESITWEDGKTLNLSVEKGEKPNQSKVEAEKDNTVEENPAQSEGESSVGNSGSSSNNASGSTANSGDNANEVEAQPGAETPGEVPQPGESDEEAPAAEGSIEVSGRPGGNKENSSLGGILFVVAAVIIGAGIVTAAVVYTKKRK